MGSSVSVETNPGSVTNPEKEEEEEDEDKEIEEEEKKSGSARTCIPYSGEGAFTYIPSVEDDSDRLPETPKEPRKNAATVVAVEEDEEVTEVPGKRKRRSNRLATQKKHRK